MAEKYGDAPVSAAKDRIEVENPTAYMLSTLTDRRYVLYLSCPGCGKETITEALYFYKHHGDMTFATFLKKLACRQRNGCGRRGMVGRVMFSNRRTYTSSVDYLTESKR